MAGLVPAIHADLQNIHPEQWLRRRYVDARVKPGHDDYGERR
jgi:hypothetical protein